MNNRELVEAMYREFFNEHDVMAAMKYVAEGYIQHNRGVEQGRAGLMKLFKKKFKQTPSFRLEIQRIISENDYVMVYLKAKDENHNTTCRVVDIYRIEGGKLAEHWDVLQPVE